MRRRHFVLIAYLLSVPLPGLIAEMLGIELPYEQAAFWLVALYMLPMSVVSELLGIPFFPAGALVYWAVVLVVLGAWAYSHRARG